MATLNGVWLIKLLGGTVTMEMIMKESTKAGKERMIEILKSHGIEMEVEGCGCCGSPCVTFVYNGETIVDDSDVNFDTQKTTPNR